MLMMVVVVMMVVVMDDVGGAGDVHHSYLCGKPRSSMRSVCEDMEENGGTRGHKVCQLQLGVLKLIIHKIITNTGEQINNT